MERNFDREQGCYECGEITETRNGYLGRHNRADGTTCAGSGTVGHALTRADRNRDI